MPRVGNPICKSFGSAGGASESYTEHGPPDNTNPNGRYDSISASGTVQGSTTQNTFCSRMRRAISCVYCEPKSRMTMVW